jgi:OFA family oxalate/formate antiporter-like MFS transporter
MNLYGPITGQLAERLGYRIVACTGACFVLGGGILLSFATAVWYLFVAAIVTGFGYSCLINTAVAIPSHYFKAKLGLAIGLGMSGVGWGKYPYERRVNRHSLTLIPQAGS